MSRPAEPRIPRPAPRGPHGFAAALFEGLVAGGVREVCCCPGSRSTPLALAAASHPALRCLVHVDERSAAFFALGLARAARRPVALVCTSGTAAANFLPAVVESHHARVPLVLLTADRPPELRDWGAPQTIDQVRLYGDRVRWYAEAPCPGPDEPRIPYARALGARAAAAAAGSPPGPVHLNLPFREPLEPRRPPAEESAAASPAAATGGTPPTLRASTPAPDSALREALGAELAAARRPVLVCGPGDADAPTRAAVAAFARRAGWPLLADAASQLRRGPDAGDEGLVSHADALLRDARFARARAPDLVVRLGAPPTSKATNAWLSQHCAARVVAIDPDGTWADPQQRVALHLRCDPAALLGAPAEEPRGGVDPAWLPSWRDAETHARRAIRSALAKEELLSHPHLARELGAALPEGAQLFASNSLPIRALDGFLPAATRSLRVLANRGANGIDGILSTAFGASVATAAPTLLFVGDLAFLHDVGALAGARRHARDCTVVVVNNDGGGIFHHLPIAEQGDEVGFEELFATPHGLDPTEIARGFGVEAERVGSLAAFRDALARSLAAGGVRVIEARVDRSADVALQRRLWGEVASALRSGEP